MNQIPESDLPKMTQDRIAGVLVLAFPVDRFGRIIDVIERATFLVEAQQELEALIAAEENPRVVIRFDQVEGISSGILGMLVTAHKIIADKGGQFHLAGLRPRVSEVFAATKLDSVLNLHETYDDAMRAIDPA